VHNNYYFLRQLSATLAQRLSEFTLVSCFSQNKDELVLEFNNGTSSFFLKASLQPEFACLSFPSTYHRARKNSVDIFPNAVMKKVTGLRQFLNERSFAILLEDENALIFKMHASRANVLWCVGDVVQEIFRNNQQADLGIALSSLDRSIDWSREEFEAHLTTLSSTYFTFGKPVWTYLAVNHFERLDINAKWNLFQRTRALLEQPRYYILHPHEGVLFSLLPTAAIEKEFTDPVAAVHEFFLARTSTTAFQNEKTSLLSQVNKKLKQALSYQEKNKHKLLELEADSHYQQWADLIMAHLQSITQGTEQITLESFYDQTSVEIKLKKELSPQKNAEVFYRKGKNQAIEIRTLRVTIALKEKEIAALVLLQKAIEDALDLAQLKGLSGTMEDQVPDKAVRIALPYNEYEFKGFRIWVGRNAKANDELTLKYAHKDDLWLHAKDVAGSHVLVKQQSGKPFPKDVIEYAAALAAYHSKRKNEALCPVAYTSKKFVRKRKGDPAGAVVVEREEVILVEPMKG
jgi:hypothetical protein